MRKLQTTKCHSVIVPEWDATTALIELMGVESLTRESYIRTDWMGDYDPNNFPRELEEELPVQFRLKTLLQTPPVVGKIQ